jgi:hypothetical protein
MAAQSPYPTVAHAFAALDELPIAGSGRIDADQPGVDFDALGRARRLLPHVWTDDAALERVNVTLQGGMVFVWRRPGMLLELMIDPYALYSLRLDTSSTTRDWTRPTLEQTVADVRQVLGLPPLAGATAGAGAGGVGAQV